MPGGFPKGQLQYTNAKVIVARAFAPPTAKTRSARLAFDPDESGHGTHVAGIAAGNTGTRASGGRTVSGIAPRAYIGNYKALVRTDSGISPAEGRIAAKPAARAHVTSRSWRESGCVWRSRAVATRPSEIGSSVDALSVISARVSARSPAPLNERSSGGCPLRGMRGRPRRRHPSTCRPRAVDTEEGSKDPDGSPENATDHCGARLPPRCRRQAPRHRAGGRRAAVSTLARSRLLRAAPGGELESVAGWTLDGGATLVAGNESFQAHSPYDRRSLLLRQLCHDGSLLVGLEHPTSSVSSPPGTAARCCRP